MKKLLLVACAIACTLFTQAQQEQDWTKFVNPLMGSQSTFELSTGNTYPAIARPWGMNFWTPQTGKMGDGWQYSYTANKIRGFKQTHQPSPWINDYGQFSIMPIVGKPEFDEEKRASWFSHKAEVAQPNYYKVYLADHDVVAEMTPTERAAMFRFTFPQSEHSYIVVDAFDKGSHIRVLPEENKIVGYTTRNSGGVPDNFKNYFVVTFDKPFTYRATFANKVLKENLNEQTANHTGAVIGFQTRRGEVVHARIASSFISPEQAELNMKELADDSFDALKEKGREVWNQALGKIEVESGTIDQQRTFYSCLYRSLLFPRKFYEMDADGQPRHYSPYNGQVLPGYMYTDTGFWDTFRALFPLLNLMYPSVNREIQEGLVNAYKESGFFPEWASPGHRGCMVGNNSASVLADAYLKGVKVDDVKTLYEGLIHGTKNVHPNVSSTGRLGHELYNKLGYVPCDVKIHENTARTLEYAYDDWCIYQLGKALNRPQKELDLLARRAMNYRNVFDKENLLMRGRKADGTFQTPFSPLKWGDSFTEGNSWHYSWSVFHDPQGLIDLMGGKKPFVQMLDSVFSVPPLFDESYYGQVIHEIREMQIMNMGNYAHGNQPIQHAIYLYNYAAQPWKAQYWLRQVMNRMYTPTPDGYCGDEDNGQTSAWYVFSSLGFYPVCPGTDQYVLGAPLFPKATLHFENGNSLVIEAPNNTANNLYIESMTFDGANYTKNFVKHAHLQKGGVIHYQMSNRPNLKRGTQPEDAPYSFSTSNTTNEETVIDWATFNIRYDNPADSLNNWKYRKEQVCNFITDKGLDIIGMQEVLHNQLEDLKTALPGFAAIGVGRDDGKRAGEYAPLFYRTDRFEVLDSHTFWLSQYPDSIGFIGWDGACTRIATWAKFKEKATGKVFMAVNTHFDHIGTEARKKGALLIIAKIKEIVGNQPAVLTGDFNVSDQSEAYQTLTTNQFVLKDAHKLVRKAKGPAYSYHDFGRQPMNERERIDFIFITPQIKVLQSTIAQEPKGATGYLSDHNPQCTRIAF